MAIRHETDYIDIKQQGLVDVALIAKITRQLYERQHFGYLLVDHDWRVLDASNNIEQLGFTEIVTGVDAREQVDFLVGMDVQSAIDLPIVLSPNGIPLHVVLLTEEGITTIVMMDASREYEQQRLVQQKANENELLLVKQRRLTKDLEQIQAALVSKNAKLEEVSRLQSSFLSGAAHEFRTPLAALLGYADLLVERLEVQSPQESYAQLNVVRRSARHLLSLVENLLDHGKLDANELVLNASEVNLQELSEEIGAILLPLARNKGVELRINRNPESLPVCLVDSSRLRQILINVVGNAIKFTDKGSVTVDFSWKEETLEILITDTGIGISPEDLKQVLRPFWQASVQGRLGTGLGLTITEKVVEMMGGELRIDSKLGQGTQVSVTLSAPDVTIEKIAKAENRVPQVRGWKFLLAEDDPDIAGLVELLLSSHGVEVVHVENGERAVQAAKEQAYDLILMDLQMPILDGYEATSQIRELGITTPVLVMTASAIESDRGRAQSVGCDGYLLKPVAIDELLVLSKELINNASEN